MKLYDIVVAKYNEDTNWIDTIDKTKYNVYVYDKNNGINKHNDIHFKHLPNIGKESHTHITHIIENYDNLAEYTLFTQARWNDHCENVLDLFNTPNTFFNNRFEIELRCDNYYGSIVEREKDNMNFGQWIQTYIEKNILYYNTNYGFFLKYNGIICIEKKYILTRPKHFYEDLLKHLQTINPETGFYFERSWYYIFNLHKQNIINEPDVIVVGSGLSGVVVAEREAQKGNKVLIIEKRDHIGGNCYDYVDRETGIRVSKYGAHLFHTNNEQVWKYVNKFSEWIPYHHKVYGLIDDKIVPIPINIKTVNTLCNTNITNEQEMIEYLDSVRDKTITDPQNGEEYCLSKFGRDLYEKVIKDYTKKQWDKYPNELDVSVLQRIPIRYNFQEGYFNDKYQALPKDGYTSFIMNIVDNINIVAMYNTDYFDYSKNIPKSVINIFYTGPIDHYYAHHNLPKLEYRSIDFQFETLKDVEYYQTNSVINYPSLNEKFTRIVEYKHFYNTKCKDTIILKEYTKDNGDPYYPVPNQRNRELYEKYKEMSMKDEKITFIGRLATYKYYNMDEAIYNSLKLYMNEREQVQYSLSFLTNGYYYFNTFVNLFIDEKKKIMFQTISDAHIGLFDNNNFICEIVIGGWENTKSCIRYKDFTRQLSEIYHNYCNDSKYKFVYLELLKNKINVYDDNNVVMMSTDCDEFQTLEIRLSSYINIKSLWIVEI